MLLQVENIYKSYGLNEVLQGISFTLDKQERIAVVGDNGVGKSTLLKIIANIEQADRGEIRKQRAIDILYIPQEFEIEGSYSVYDYVEQIFQTVNKSLENNFEDTIKVERLLKAYSKSLKLDSKMLLLSPGERTKVILITVMISQAEIIIWDEPTNNLDIATIGLSEEYIKSAKASFIIVSHDRLFLDNVATKVLSIDYFTRKSELVSGRYSDYLQHRAEQLENQKLIHQKQKLEKKRLEQIVREKIVKSDAGSRFVSPDGDKNITGYKRDRAGRSGKAAKALRARVGQHTKEMIRNPDERDKLKIKVELNKARGNADIFLNKLSCGYSISKPVLTDVSLNISFGEKILIFGSNGSGKTCLIKTISDRLEPIAGEIYRGSTIIFGNISQELELLPNDLNLIDYFKEVGALKLDELAYATANKFGFSTDELKKKLNLFSPGGKTRILLASFELQGVNTLILDEPSNHLDLDAMFAIENLISSFNGTVIVISHDRWLLNSLEFDEIYKLNNGQLRHIESLGPYFAIAQNLSNNLWARTKRIID